ncbi:hypothetical protein IFM89_017488 [Coptis chinensis]|uniref:Coilin n=1 Tax=Coptis chinensis TaxID=261450 RepID=A0A835LW64_9MAGN|nr:hypothetical protein IFM89_017488 [Coptis chinensis]
MGTVRLRVVFEDRHLLTKTQKSQGLKRTWILLKPGLETISDLTSYLIHSFNLRNASPDTLHLSMDGFVLPYFESTHFFKDKDIIRVKRKDSDEANLLENTEVVEKGLVYTGVKLLALEEFDKESGGYQSEPEDIEYDRPEKSSGKSISKKRKSSKELHNAKRKKSKGTSPEGVENDVHLKDQANSHKGVLSNSNHKDEPIKTRVKSKKASDAEVGSHIENNVQRMPTIESFDNLEENGGKTIEEIIPEGIKKGPSRSARRKKAKRKWLRELLDSQNKELVQSVSDKIVRNESNEHQESEEKTDTEAEIVPIVVRPGHIRFEPLGRDEADQRTHDPLENFQWNGITSKRKGQKWGMEKTLVSKSNGHEDSREDYIVTEHLHSNAIASQRNGQKMAIENSKTSKSTVEDSMDILVEKLNPEEKELGHDAVDFEKLKPLSCLPKEGDVVAYRLVELSSTWCPELSAFRVGKVLWLDSASRVMLVPVPGYPVVSDEKRDEDEGEITQGSDSSLYREDGSLEIDFASLIDVRIFKHGYSHSDALAIGSSMEAPVRNREAPVSSKEAVSCTQSNDKNKETHVITTENGGSVDVWEEISQVLSEKKTQLSKEIEERWTTKESSGKSQWPYKALRSSALGPTMAFLRAGNDL